MSTCLRGCSLSRLELRFHRVESDIDENRRPFGGTKRKGHAWGQWASKGCDNMNKGKRSASMMEDLLEMAEEEHARRMEENKKDRQRMDEERQRQTT